MESLYDLMDSTYDAEEVRACSRQLGHAPLINSNPRRDARKKAESRREPLAQRRLGQVTAQAVRYGERSTVERVNGRLGDEFGERHVRGRGHLMFGMPAPTVGQLMRRMQ